MNCILPSLKIANQMKYFASVKVISLLTVDTRYILAGFDMICRLIISKDNDFL